MHTYIDYICDASYVGSFYANEITQDSFETCPPLDIVLIGAHFPGYDPNEAELAFIRKAHSDCAAFLTICGGFVPAQLAGVLVGKTCTAPRFMVAELQKQDPRTTWVERRCNHDGKIWTSGALLNGLDMMREFMLMYWPELTKITIPLSGQPVRSAEYVGTDGFPVPLQQ
jgi:transcriptional regulator GlxA family with amidase domain